MGTSLYLLSGLLCDETVWTAQKEALSEVADVHTVDFRGYDSIVSMAESVLKQAPQRFSVVGHSMGARVALEILRQAPDRVERLALLDTGTHPVREGEAEKRQVLLDLAAREGMAALADRWLPPMMHPDHASDPAYYNPLKAMVERMTVDDFRGQVRALLGRPDASGLIADIRCPTLVAVGREDAWSTLPQHEAMAGQIPGSQLVVFEHSGHMAPFEAPTAVNDALMAWLSLPTSSCPFEH